MSARWQGPPVIIGMARFHIPLRNKYKIAHCLSCNANLHVEDSPRMRGIRYVCCACGGSDIGGQDEMLDDLMCQCMDILLEAPSQLPIPSWPEIFAMREMKGKQPRGGGIALVHLLAGAGLTEPLRLTLQRWPESISLIEHNNGGTALHMALLNANGKFQKTGQALECARMLLDHKADASAPDRRLMTPLDYAVHSEAVEAVRWLVDAKADTNYKLPSGQTALHTAADTGNASLISALIEAGARFRRDNTGRTPLHEATLTNRNITTDERALAVVQALMAAPNAAEHIDDWGATGRALDGAVTEGFSRTAQYLLDCKANVNGAAAEVGVSPLILALRRNHKDVAKQLVAAGACTHPLQQSGTDKVISLIEAAGPMKGLKLEWCRSVESPTVSACAKCGFDSSEEAIARSIKRWKERSAIFDEPDAEITPRCSNAKCSGELSRTINIVSDADDSKTRTKTIPPRLKKCSRCRTAAYCSQACQRQHWLDGHKRECKAASADHDAAVAAESRSTRSAESSTATATTTATASSPAAASSTSGADPVKQTE